MDLFTSREQNTTFHAGFLAYLSLVLMFLVLKYKSVFVYPTMTPVIVLQSRRVNDLVNMADSELVHINNASQLRPPSTRK
ncbi:hypothetical protein [Vibrio neptunius]|uniref:hypothetical protein n=1 Tax=Vibrio neptunius TaxID=170651 RepID=UPI003CE5A46B